MGREAVIDVAEQFGVYVGGRYRRACKHSAEEFRDDVLLPAIDTFEVVKVDLGGVVGMPPSWAEEAFGGAVRMRGHALILKRLRFVSTSDRGARRASIATQMIEEQIARDNSNGGE